MNDWFHLTIYGLACFRLAVMLSEDDGPVKMFQRFRSFLKKEARKHPGLRKSDVHHGVECLRCSSIWISAPIALFWFYHNQLPHWLAATGDIFAIAMALSALAILFNRMKPVGHG